MKFTAADLVATLAASPEESYVRVVADWLAHGEVASAGPALTGRPVVDALVAAGVVLDLPGITVSVPSPHYLLALKVQAARIDRDQDDIRFLARETGAKTADDVLRIAE